ncbi:MAG: hypothetical protein SGCHY_004475 [Lobulomycetales sp.]
MHSQNSKQLCSCAHPRDLPFCYSYSYSYTHMMESLIQYVNWQPIFQRVAGAWMLLAIILAVLGPFLAPSAYALYFILLHLVLLTNNARYALSTVTFYYQTIACATTDWLKKYTQHVASSSLDSANKLLPLSVVEWDTVLHVIVIPNYCESDGILRETLDVLASHDIARSQYPYPFINLSFRYRVCLAMEETEAGAHEKAVALEKAYAGAFHDICHTIHPRGIAGEHRGKGSNVAWAVRKMSEKEDSSVSSLIEEGSGNLLHPAPGKRPRNVVTIMDADNCVAQDYFHSINFHYSTANPEDRRIMMFTPGCVFDRNSDQVPILVRLVDFGWSIGSMSNLNPSSPAKLPLSTYSISMDLCASVGFWDTGSEALGEDMHMFLKCFFSTAGRVIVKTIFSPISVCNVQASDTKGLTGYLNGISARFTQGKRHLWASLDTGYMLRRAFLSFTSPSYDEFENGPRVPMSSHDDKDPDDPKRRGKTRNAFAGGLPLWRLMHLFHRVLEAHSLMCQGFLLIFLSAVISPGGTIWNFLSVRLVGPGIGLHPHVGLALTIAGIIQKILLIPNIITISYYYYYHQFVGFDRWVLQPAGLLPSSLGAQNLANPAFAPSSVLKSHRNLSVHPLGRRPAHAAPLNQLRFTIEFAAGSVVSAACFFLIPLLWAQSNHLLGRKDLDYAVSEKPEIPRQSAGPHVDETVIMVCEEPEKIKSEYEAAESITTCGSNPVSPLRRGDGESSDNESELTIEASVLSVSSLDTMIGTYEPAVWGKLSSTVLSPAN